MTPRQRGLRRGFVIAGAALLAGVGALAGTHMRSGSGGDTPAVTASTTATLGGAFRLVDTHGATVTDQTLRGKPYAIFFGFTRCPNVCPTMMNRMALLHKQLGADADKLATVFVSVDPEHDKPADIAGFLSMFDAPVIGLTGSQEQLDRIEKAFRVYVQREPLPGGDYTIDHTALVYLMDRQGRFVEPLSASEPLAANLAQLRKLITI